MNISVSLSLMSHWTRTCLSPIQVFPMSNGGVPVSEFPFTRTGLLGFIGPAGLIFVAGKMDGLMVVGGRRHNADDIVATALAVEPMKFVYRGRYVRPRCPQVKGQTRCQTRRFNWRM